MDFFTRQDQARRKTGLLVLYFGLSVLLTIAFIYLALAYVLALTGDGGGRPTPFYWNGSLLGAVAGGTLCVISFGCLIKIIALSKGGGVVARLLGGELVSPNTTDPDQRKLLNVVEEMAIASGTPVPEIYLLAREEAINAFAAGVRPDNAAIGVTRGCIRLLNRDELQGVIAHEFSHILNGDMRLNLRLMGIVHGLICLTMLGHILLRTGSIGSRYSGYALGARSQNKSVNPLPIIGVILLLFGAIGVLFGRLIKSAVSRQREYLADAAAVQFTRNPSGLAGALKKIGGLVYGSRLQAPRAEEASHLFFGNGLKSSFVQVFATHPPLVDRIRALEPDFYGTFSKLDPTRPLPGAPGPSALPKAAPARRRPSLGDLLGPAAAGTLPAQGLVQQVGRPQTAHLDFAVQLLAHLPSGISTATQDSLSAVALVYGLLLSPEEPLRGKQIQLLRDNLDPIIRQEAERLAPEILKLQPIHRLPLIEISCPALRQMSPRQYLIFRQTVQSLIAGDEQLDLFEFALQKSLLRHLNGYFEPQSKRGAGYRSPAAMLPDAVILLSALAHIGHNDPAQAEQAFARGYGLLEAGAPPAAPLPLSQCNLLYIDPALDRLADAHPEVKRRLLSACAETVSADGQVTAREAELLRAISDSLSCPMPPVLASL